VRLSAPGSGLAAQVKHVEYFGSHWIAEFTSAAGTLKAVVDKSVKPQEGEHVGLSFDTRRVVMFDAASEQLLQSATTITHKPSMCHG